MTSVRLCVAPGKMSAVWAYRKMIFSPMWSLCGNTEEVMRRRRGHTLKPKAGGSSREYLRSTLTIANVTWLWALCVHPGPLPALCWDEMQEKLRGELWWHPRAHRKFPPGLQDGVEWGCPSFSSDWSSLWGKQTYPSIHFHSRHMFQI